MSQTPRPVEYKGNPGGITKEMDYVVACAALSFYREKLANGERVWVGEGDYFSEEALKDVVASLEAATEEWRNTRLPTRS